MKYQKRSGTVDMKSQSGFKTFEVVCGVDDSIEAGVYLSLWTALLNA